MEETLTVTRLGITGKLKLTLQSTNPIESMISTVRVIHRNVKHWTSGEMCLRWTAAGMLEAETRFRKVQGYRGLANLAVEIEPTYSATVKASLTPRPRRTPQHSLCNHDNGLSSPEVPRRAGQPLVKSWTLPQSAFATVWTRKARVLSKGTKIFTAIELLLPLRLRHSTSRSAPALPLSSKPAAWHESYALRPYRQRRRRGCGWLQRTGAAASAACWLAGVWRSASAFARRLSTSTSHPGHAKAQLRADRKPRPGRRRGGASRDWR